MNHFGSLVQRAMGRSEFTCYDCCRRDLDTRVQGWSHARRCLSELGSYFRELVQQLSLTSDVPMYRNSVRSNFQFRL